MKSRGGYSLVEMMITLLITGIVIGVVGDFAYRQQRFHREVVVVAERLEQLEEVAALMPTTLRAIAPGEGDIPPLGARDTSIEFRATIATAVICDTGRARILLAPARGDAPRLGSILTRPAAGDTAWSLVLDTAGEHWAPAVIAAVSDSIATCTLGGRPQWAGVQQSGLVVQTTDPLPAGRGTPVRVTRVWRYSLYKASDGLWYVGAKDWNPETGRFNTIQPVGGPFLSAARGGVVLTYRDSSGRAIASGAVDPRGIAVIEAGFRADSLIPGKLPHAIGVAQVPRTVIALRNRAR